jgi:hypothetical protein
MRVLLIASLLALAARPSLGAEAKGAVTAAPGGGVKIASPPCDALVPGADYIAGVDAGGKPVAPADLPRAASPVTADTISIEINASLAGQFGIPQSGGAYRTKGTVGYVTVQDGRVLFNGKPLSDNASAAIGAACQTLGKEPARK